MRDFNFFQPYFKKQRKRSEKRSVIYTCIYTVAIVLIIVSVASELFIRKIEEEATAVSAMVDSEESLEKRAKVSLKENEVKKIQDYYNTLAAIDGEIKNLDIIDDVFLKKITDKVPQAVFFKSINISQSSVQITGVAADRLAIAEFEQKLRTLPDFGSVFISTISEDTVGYSFTIFFQIKGGIDDEANN